MIRISKMISLRAFILQLLLAMMIVAWSSSLLSAEEGLVLPDTARISFSWQVTGDTVTITINNLSANPVQNFSLTEFTFLPATLVECLVDNSPVAPEISEGAFGSVYDDLQTNRWVIGDFDQSLRLTYHSFGGLISFSAAHPYPVFGFLPGIGPPTDLHWIQ